MTEVDVVQQSMDSLILAVFNGIHTPKLFTDTSSELSQKGVEEKIEMMNNHSKNIIECHAKLMNDIETLIGINRSKDEQMNEIEELNSRHESLLAEIRELEISLRGLDEKISDKMTEVITNLFFLFILLMVYSLLTHRSFQEMLSEIQSKDFNYYF